MSMLKRLLILALMALLAGCGSVRNAHRARNDIPPGERTVTAAEIGLDKNTVLTIDKAVEIALRYHPSVIQSQQRMLSARASFNSTRGSYLPQVDLSVSSRLGTGNLSVASANNDPSRSDSAGISINQLFYDFGKTPASIRQSYQNLLAAESNYQSTINNTLYKVKEAYYDLIKQSSLVRVAEETVRQFEKRLEQVKGFAEVGRRIRYDVTKTEVDLAEARLTLIRSLNALRVSRATLNNSLGLAEDPPYTIQTPATPPEMTYQLDELWSKARSNNPELLAQTAYESAAYAAVDKSISDLYPSISINGSYTWSGSDFPLVWNWLLGGTIRLNIFQGFQKVNQINDSVANLRIARAQRAELEQRLYLDLNRALAQLEDATQSLRISGLAVKQAEENLILVQQRYEVGKASSVELTDAQVSLATARSNYVQADFNYRIAIALINKTIFAPHITSTAGYPKQ